MSSKKFNAGTSRNSSSAPAAGGSAGQPRADRDEAGVVGGITVLLLTIPLLLLSVLTIFNNRLSQADHDLAWAATSAARSGANCVRSAADAYVPSSNTTVAATAGAVPAGNAPCTLREVALAVEETIRSLLLDHRNVFCLNTNSTGMVLEYLNYNGDLIYAYGIGAVLFDRIYWPDRGDAEELQGTLRQLYGDETTNPPTAPDPEAALSDNPYLPLQPGARVDILGNRLALNPAQGDQGSVFDTTMLTPLGLNQPVGQIRVNLLCDYAQGADLGWVQCAGLSRNAERSCESEDGIGQYLARASSREASASAVVPPLQPA